jgi:hypothetical protein
MRLLENVPGLPFPKGLIIPPPETFLDSLVLFGLR